MTMFRILLSLASAAGLGGCAVMTVTGAAVGVATTAVSVTTDVAVAAGKGAVKMGEWAVDKATADKPAATAPNPTNNTSSNVQTPPTAAVSSQPAPATDGLELRPLMD
ncbi:hypothetical protein ACUHMQ_04795 [Chitinimonas sp. PSY-7]|uniref:hypothetical protein n=1 Tax=Chitinimonas sp. PSY-7 TaxID=3459088 RepID=UPI004040216F